MLSCGLYPFDTAASVLSSTSDLKRQAILHDNILRLEFYLFQLLHVAFSSPYSSAVFLSSSIRIKDPSELADSARFCNNYSTVFLHRSPEFREFVLMLLHPDPARRSPPGDDFEPPVLRIFRRFPQLLASGALTDDLVRNLTPSTVQSALLKVGGKLMQCVFLPLSVGGSFAGC